MALGGHIDLKETCYDEIFGAVSNGRRGNAEDDGECDSRAKTERHGRVGGVDEEESGEFRGPRRACRKNEKVASSGVTDTRNDIGGYSIVEANSYDAAAALFADSPHLSMPGATVEVMEIKSM